MVINGRWKVDLERRSSGPMRLLEVPLGFLSEQSRGFLILKKYTFLVVELFSFLCLAKVLPIHFNGCKTTSPKSGDSGKKSSPPTDSFMAFRDIKLESNIDRPGMDFAHAAYYGLTLEQCAQGCLDVTSCKAFTYVMPGFGGPNSAPACHLKNSVPDPVSKEGCVSGVKS